MAISATNLLIADGLVVVFYTLEHYYLSKKVSSSKWVPVAPAEAGITNANGLWPKLKNALKTYADTGVFNFSMEVRTPKSEIQKRYDAGQYSSALCSILLAYELAEGSDRAAAVKNAAEQCLLRCSGDVLLVIQGIANSAVPIQSMYNEVIRIESMGMDLMQFLALGSSLEPVAGET